MDENNDTTICQRGKQTSDGREKYWTLAHPCVGSGQCRSQPPTGELINPRLFDSCQTPPHTYTHYISICLTCASCPLSITQHASLPRRNEPIRWALQVAQMDKYNIPIRAVKNDVRDKISISVHLEFYILSNEHRTHDEHQHGRLWLPHYRQGVH